MRQPEPRLGQELSTSACLVASQGNILLFHSKRKNFSRADGPSVAAPLLSCLPAATRPTSAEKKINLASFLSLRRVIECDALTLCVAVKGGNPFTRPDFFFFFTPEPGGGFSVPVV